MGESAAFRAAVERMQQGDPAGAEAILANGRRTAREKAGAQSAAYARACYEYASALAAFGQLRRALEPFREACAIDVRGDADATRSRLTYLAQFGELLEQAGELEEAERVLRQSVEGRRSFYGKDHAGYAFGLEPLAAVLLRKGSLHEASALCDEAWQIFANTGHERLATALALRAEIAKTIDPSQPAFLKMQGPDALFAALAEAVFARTPANAEAWSNVLQEAHAFVVRRFGPDHPLCLRALSEIANHEQRRGDDGDAARRQRALSEIVAAFDRRGDLRQATLAALGLALAQSDAGDDEASLATYERAQTRATALGEPLLRAKVSRNMGLLLSRMNRREAAATKLRAAAELAADAGDDREVQAAEVALGIFLQHGGQLDEARRHLERALAAGDPAHPDALCARGHLEAIETGAACGCGDMTHSIAATLEQMVRSALPDPQLLARLDVDLSSTLDIAVHVTRTPTASELEQLESAVHRAEATLRDRLQRGRSESVVLPND